MDFLNECPLNTEEEFLTEMVETCKHPAVLLNKRKRIAAKSVLAGDKDVLVRLGLPAGKGKLREFYRYLGSLKDGDVVRLERGGSIKGVLICFPMGYLFYFDDTLSEKPENEPEFLYSSSISLVTRRRGRKPKDIPRTRREQSLPPVTDKNVAELKQDSIYKKLSGNSAKQPTKVPCFNPALVVEGVCTAAKRLLSEKGKEFKVSVEEAELYCHESCDKYSDALMTMMLVATSRTENGSIGVKGFSDGSRYTAEFSFKCAVENMGKRQEVDAWDSLFGEYFDKIYAISRRLFWDVRVMKRTGGVLSLSLTVPLSKDSSSSLLHPQIPTQSYYEGLVKKHYALLW